MIPDEEDKLSARRPDSGIAIGHWGYDACLCSGQGAPQCDTWT
jgi:hypothetical protein